MAAPKPPTDSRTDLVTLMYVPGRAGAIRRFNVPRFWIRRATAGLVLLAVAILALGVDYIRMRGHLDELDYLRSQTREQGERLDGYNLQMEQITDELARISRLDRQLRVITDLDPADPLPLPGIGGVEGEPPLLDEFEALTRERRHRAITEALGRLSDAASAEADSLAELIAHLEDQTARLRATPSISPTKGWITSSFGYRTSPFTGNREYHRGLDIAGRLGTPVIAPADGVVRFAGVKRALGNSVTLRHGYGLQTVYGHLKEIAVKSGQRVKRGDLIGRLGSTGRSTGPHLHYQVEVNGVPVSPRNYILD